MRWPLSRSTKLEEPRPWPPMMAHASSEAGDEAAGQEAVFVCSTCGRTSLPPAGDWDPSICLECDATINFDAEEACRDH